VEEVNSDEELSDLIDKTNKKDKKKHKRQILNEKKMKKSKMHLEDPYEGQELFTIEDPSLKKRNLEEEDYTDPEDE